MSKSKSTEERVLDIINPGAKTHKGRLHLKKFESKEKEGIRSTLFMKGTKSSNTISKLFDTFFRVIREGSRILSKNNDVLPFEDPSKVEFLTNKNLCPLFIFGNNTKKRPNNLIFGRIFEQKKLDMVELGVTLYEEIEANKKWNKVPTSVKPVLIFNGDIFEYDPVFKRLRNLLHDMFCQGNQLPGVDVLYGTRLVLSVTANEDKKVHIRCYTSNLKENDVKVSTNVGASNDQVLEEIGPRLDMVLRRSDLADEARWKAATRVFKAKKKEGGKNIERELMSKMGRVHVQQQDINLLQLRNKGLLKKRGKKSEGADADAGADAEGEAVVEGEGEAKKLKKTGDGEKKNGAKKLKTE